MLTDYGFVWQQVEITRVASYDGNLLIEVKTPRELMHLRVTPTGFIRTQTYKRKKQ